MIAAVRTGVYGYHNNLEVLFLQAPRELEVRTVIWRTKMAATGQRDFLLDTIVTLSIL